MPKVAPQQVPVEVVRLVAVLALDDQPAYPHRVEEGLVDLQIGQVFEHVPFFWGINGILIANSGTCSTKRLRGLTPSSWNEVEIDASTIKVFLHYPDGRRELAVIFSRKTRALTREAFYMTEEFISSNRLSAVI